MARIRTIKPEFFTSEDIVALTPFARLLYVALWCEADKEGRLTWRPKTFKMRYFPADTLVIEDLCNELTAHGLVTLYGDGLAFIPSFTSHQHINPRETASVLPDPHASSTRDPRVTTRESTVSDAQGGRKEGKGKEYASRRDELFARFWDAYPSKVGKDAARKSFDKRIPDDELLARMLTAITTQKQSDRWRKNGGEFIPNPATWLNQARWEDQLGAGNDDPYDLRNAA